jgi:hypothetical protein
MGTAGSTMKKGHGHRLLSKTPDIDKRFLPQEPRFKISNQQIDAWLNSP